MTGALLAATVVVPGSVTALADGVSGPVAAGGRGGWWVCCC